MREIDVQQIEDTLYALCRSACCEIGDDVLALLEDGLRRERSPFGRDILRQLIENDRLACERQMPICQDTGMAVVFLDVGQDVHLTGGDLTEAVNAGVRRAYRDGCFRNSVLTPLERVNTGDNTPAVLHVRILPGEQVHITVAPKGFGSENMSRLGMLTPSQGREGVLDFVVETVRLAGANPCPPVVVGVGLGGTSDRAALLAKRALLRSVDTHSADPFYAEMEAEALERINALGIGPQGLGGRTTALSVAILPAPTHIAGLPCCVNLGCHVTRHASVTL